MTSGERMPLWKIIARVALPIGFGAVTAIMIAWARAERPPDWGRVEYTTSVVHHRPSAVVITITQHAPAAILIELSKWPGDVAGVKAVGDEASPTTLPDWATHRIDPARMKVGSARRLTACGWPRVCLLSITEQPPATHSSIDHQPATEVPPPVSDTTIIWPALGLNALLFALPWAAPVHYFGQWSDRRQARKRANSRRHGQNGVTAPIQREQQSVTPG